jgi:predicted CoA-substrate-specific enzyme activase
MLFAGIDVGAQSVKAAVLSDNKLVFSSTALTDEEGGIAARQALDKALAALGLPLSSLTAVVSTGIGKDAVAFATGKRTEEICHSRGAYWLFPSARTVLDVGAGGYRAMRIDSRGKLIDFAVNSKCAAGTGSFLDAVTHVLDTSLEDIGTMAVSAEKRASVSSYCAVFAESEIISNIHRGVSKESILAGVCYSVAERLVEVLHRVKVTKDIVITGGVAQNIGVVRALEEIIGLEAKVPEEAQIVGALGAALIAQETSK